MMLAASDTGDARRAGPRSVLSAGGPPVAPIDRLQKKISEAGLSISAVCRKAMVDERHFQRALKGEKRVTRWYIRRCELAIEALQGGDLGEAEPSIQHLTAIYRGLLAEACRYYGVDMDAARVATAGDGVRARHLALYLTNTELAIRGATLARLFGLTRAAVTLAIQGVEDRREDAAFDAAVSLIARRITGRT